MHADFRLGKTLLRHHLLHDAVGRCAFTFLVESPRQRIQIVGIVRLLFQSQSYQIQTALDIKIVIYQCISIIVQIQTFGNTLLQSFLKKLLSEKLAINLLW